MQVLAQSVGLDCVCGKERLIWGAYELLYVRRCEPRACHGCERMYRLTVMPVPGTNQRAILIEVSGAGMHD